MRRLALAAAFSLLATTSLQAQAVRSGFDANDMSATDCANGCALGSAHNDDGSQGPIGVGFTFDFFGTNYSNVYLNTNGNLTLTGPLLTYTPFGITGTTMPMFAPFFGDVDTRSGNAVTYGSGTVGGHTAWGATWDNVCYYSENCDLTNTFQALLIDRSDVAAGDFDIEFNYDQIQWETGDASGGSGGLGGTSATAGWTNGTGDYYQLNGSLVNGALLDDNLSTGLIHNRLNSDVDGRYIFSVRGGSVVPPPTSVPEPAALLLLATGLLGIAVVAKRRRVFGA